MFSPALPRLVMHPFGVDFPLRRAGHHAVVWVYQTICGLNGHDDLMHATRDRQFLQCTECGRETPGWQINPRFAPRAKTSATTVSHRAPEKATP